MAEDTLDLGLASFGDPPESVARTVRDMEKIALRRAANARVAAERDTERYLVVVYPDRAAREAVLRALGLPEDERYILGDAVELRRREGWDADSALIHVERPSKAADPGDSGAAG